MNCVLDNGVRILSRSRGQKVRGLKHRQHRPSLIVADDVEDLDWVRTQENRDKSDRWFRGNVLPSVDEQTAASSSSATGCTPTGLMARLKNTGIFKVLEFPLLREGDGTEIERCTWKAKYPTQEAIDRKRDELGDIGFRREMLLQVVPEEGQDVLPGGHPLLRRSAVRRRQPPGPRRRPRHQHQGERRLHGDRDRRGDVARRQASKSTSSRIPIIRRMTFSDTMEALDNVRAVDDHEQRVLR